MNIRIHLFAVWVIFLFSCTDNSAIVKQIEVTNKLLSKDIENQGNEIAITVVEYGIDEEPTLKAKSIKKAYQSFDQSITTLTSQSELSELLKSGSRK